MTRLSTRAQKSLQLLYKHPHRQPPCPAFSFSQIDRHLSACFFVRVHPVIDVLQMQHRVMLWSAGSKTYLSGFCQSQITYCCTDPGGSEHQGDVELAQASCVSKRPQHNNTLQTKLTCGGFRLRTVPLQSQVHKDRRSVGYTADATTASSVRKE